MAYIPDFLTSIISLDILASKGTHQSTWDPKWLYAKTMDFHLIQIGSHWVIEEPEIEEIKEIEEESPDNSSYTSLATTNSEPRFAIRTPIDIHIAMAYAGPNAIKHIDKAFRDIQMTKEPLYPKTTEYDICDIAKQIRVVSRRSDIELEASEAPFN